jgi:hypothetical protein
LTTESFLSHHDEEVDGEEEVLDRAGHATLHLEMVAGVHFRSLKFNLIK